MKTKRIFECGLAVLVTVLLSCEVGCAGTQRTAATAAVTPPPKPEPKAEPPNETVEAIKAYLSKSFAEGGTYVKEQSGKSWDEIKADFKKKMCEP